MSMPRLRPAPPAPRSLLGEAAAAPSLRRLCRRHGLDAPDSTRELRQAMFDCQSYDASQRGAARCQSRARARAARRAWRASCWSTPRRSGCTCTRTGGSWMRCGWSSASPNMPTPMMTALIRFASLNPYWNVPPDLAAERIAPECGQAAASPICAALGYEVLSDWDRRCRGRRPGDGRLEGGCRRDGRGPRAPVARASTMRWGR